MPRVLSFCGCLMACLLSQVFGQITVAEGSKNIFVDAVAKNAVKEPMLQLQVSNPAGGAASEVYSLAVSAAANGTGHDVTDLTSGSVQLFWDKDSDGRVSAGDTGLGGGAFNADNGQVSINGFTIPLAANSKANLLVVYTFGSGAATGESYRARIAANTDVGVRLASNQSPLTVSGAPVEGYLRTAGHGTLTYVRINQDPDGAVAIPNGKLIPLFCLDLLVNDVENLNITSLNFKDVGSANMRAGVVPGSVCLFKQSAKPTIPNSAITSGTFEADNGLVRLTPKTPLTLARNSTTRVWVTIDVVSSTLETIGAKYQLQVPTSSTLACAGQFSLELPTLVGTAVTGPLWEFNYNPINFDTSNDPGAILISKTARRAPAMVFKLQNDPKGRNEAVTLSRLAFSAGGTINEAQDVAFATLYRDNPPRGKYDATDVAITSTTFAQDNGTIDFSFPVPAVYAANASDYYLVAYDLNGNATNGETIALSIVSRVSITAIGAVSKVNSAIVPAPFNGIAKTIGNPRAEFYLQTAPKNIPTIVAPGATNFPLLGFRLHNQTDEDLLMRGFNLDLTGTGNEAAWFTGFKLYYDANGNGIIEAGDTQVGPSYPVTSNGGDAKVLFTIPEAQASLVTRGTDKYFTLMADIAPSVIGDGSEQFSIVADADDDIVLTGASSGSQAEFTTPQPPFTVSRTIMNPTITLKQYRSYANVLGCINGAYGLIGMQFTVPDAEDLLIQKIRFTVSGTLDDPTHLVGAYTWTDNNKNLDIDSNETNGSIVYTYHYMANPVTTNDGAGVIDMTANPARAERTADMKAGVGLDFSAVDEADALAQLGKTITPAQVGNLVIEGVGARSGRPIQVIDSATTDDIGETMTFDRGSLTVTTATLQRTAAPPAGRNIEALSLSLKTSIMEVVAINQLRIRTLGTLDESKHIKPKGIHIWQDNNFNGKLETTTGGDDMMASADPPTSDNGYITFTAADFRADLSSNRVYSFSVPARDRYLITVDLTSDAPEGSTLQFSIDAPADITAKGLLSLVTYQPGVELLYPKGTPLLGPAILIGRGGVDFQTEATFLNDVDNKPSVVMAPAAQGYEVARIAAKSLAAEDVLLHGLQLRVTGTANDLTALKLNGLALYKTSIQANNLVSTSTFNADNGMAQFTNFRTTVSLQPLNPTSLIFTFSGSGNAQRGEGMQLSIAGAELDALGVSSGLPITRMIPNTIYQPAPIVFGPGKLRVRFTDQSKPFLLPLPLSQPFIVQKLTLVASRTENIQLDELNIHATGTANEAQILQNGTVLLEQRPGATPTLLGSAAFVPGNNGIAQVRGLNVSIAAEQTVSNYSLDVSPLVNAAVSSTTMQFDIDTTASVKGTGTSSNWPVEIAFEDQAGGDYNNAATKLTGQPVLISTGLVKLSKGTNNPRDATIRGDETRLPLMQVAFQIVAGLEAVTVDSISLHAIGSCNEPLQIHEVGLYSDVDADGRATAADVLLGKVPFNANDGIATFSGLQLTYAEAATGNWIFAADLSGDRQINKTLQFEMAASIGVTGVGSLTQKALTWSNGSPAPVGAKYTIVPPPQNAARNWTWFE